MKSAKLLLVLSSAVCIIMMAHLPASALNIVLTNDDGFEAENIQALFNALKAAGHDVIMSAPYLNQSAAAGAIGAAKPIGRTWKRSSRGLFKAGVPGLGPTTIAADQYYLNGSPVDAVLYGIDILAVDKWGQAPDLVIAGPNVGNNLGLMTVHSGTVGVAVAAINRGIPAIAVSAFMGESLITPPEEAELNAQLTVRLVAVLANNQVPLLPLGYGLNVNLPQLDISKSADAYDYTFTQIGMATDYGPKFYARLKDNALLSQYLPGFLLYSPGVAVEVPYTAAGYAEDTDPKSEFNAIQTGTVTISMIQGTYQTQMPDEVKGVLSNLCKPENLLED